MSNYFMPLTDKSVFNDVMPNIEKFDNNLSAKDIANKYRTDAKTFETDAFVSLRLERKFKEGVHNLEDYINFKTRFFEARQLTQKFFDIKCPEFKEPKLSTS